MTDDTGAPTTTSLDPLWDAVTLRTLAATGVGDGWQCLEIGAGVGAVGAWLRERVGPAGHVVTAAVDPPGLAPLGSVEIEILHDQVATAPSDGAGYHLIHARLVLGRLPKPHAVARKLVDALRPGGWLVIEDYDIRTISAADPPLRAWATICEALLRSLRSAGTDPLFGGRVVRLLRMLGLVDVTADACAKPMPMPELASVVRPTVEHLNDKLLRTGVSDEEELNQAITQLQNTSDAVAFTPLFVSTRGRRPTQPSAAPSRATVNHAECPDAAVGAPESAGSGPVTTERCPRKLGRSIWLR